MSVKHKDANYTCEKIAKRMDKDTFNNFIAFRTFHQGYIYETTTKQKKKT